jgi:hypothetical protein
VQGVGAMQEVPVFNVEMSRQHTSALIEGYKYFKK